MFQKLRSVLRRLSPSPAEVDLARAELIARANKSSLPYESTDDYAALFASLRRAQARPYVEAVNASDPNYNQILASVLKAQLIGLRSRLSTLAASPASGVE